MMSSTDSGHASTQMPHPEHSSLFTSGAAIWFPFKHISDAPRAPFSLPSRKKITIKGGTRNREREFSGERCSQHPAQGEFHVTPAACALTAPHACAYRGAHHLHHEKKGMRVHADEQGAVRRDEASAFAGHGFRGQYVPGEVRGHLLRRHPKPGRFRAPPLHRQGRPARHLPARPCLRAGRQHRAHPLLVGHDGHAGGHPLHGSRRRRLGDAIRALLRDGRADTRRPRADHAGLRAVDGWHRFSAGLREVRRDGHPDGAGQHGQAAADDAGFRLDGAVRHFKLRAAFGRGD